MADCVSDTRCRVGDYYGDPDEPGWLAYPRTGDATEPRVSWHTATLAEMRFACGPECAMSYFFEARRRRLSPCARPCWTWTSAVPLVAMADGPAVVVPPDLLGPRGGPYHPPGRGASLRDAVTAIHFDPDGRLTFTWLAGNTRTPVTERVSVPSVPR